MSYDDCIAEVKAQAGDLTDAQIEQVGKTLDDLVKKVREQDPANMDAALRAAVAADAEQKQIVAILNKRNKALNIQREHAQFEYLVSTWDGEYAEGWKALHEGTNVARMGARDSTGKAQDARVVQYWNALNSKLLKMGVHPEATSGKFDLEIRKVMAELDKSNTPDLTDFSDTAIKAASVISEVNEFARLEANRAGAWIGKAVGWVHRTQHDSGNIKALGETGWIDLVKNNIDWSKTMPDLPAEKMGNELRKMYLQFVSGYHPLTEGAAGPNVSGNPASRLGKERVLIWKSPEAEHEYFTTIGNGTLMDAVSQGLDHLGRDVVLMEHWGPNAAGVRENIKNKIGNALKNGNDAEAMTRFSDTAKRMDRTVWPNITGETRIPGSHLLAVVGQTARNVQTMASLTYAVASQISDISTRASEVSWQEGGGFFREIFAGIKDILSPMPTAERAWVASELGVVFEGLTPYAQHNFNQVDGVAGKMAWLAQMTYKLNLNNWLTDKTRLSFAASMAHRYGADHATKAFADLGDGIKRTLSLYGIDADKWEIARRAVGDGPDGRKYLLPELLDDMPDSDFGATTRQANNARRELKDALKTMYFDRATTAVLNPDLQGRATMNQGSNAGTWVGEGMRSIAQFKSFVAAMMQRVLGREIYGRTSNVPHGVGDAFKQVMANGNGELMGLAQVFLGATAFGYAALTLSELARGRTPREPESAADYAKLFAASVAKGGGGGIYGDFLAGNMKNSFGGTPIDTLLGPVAGDFNSVADIIGRLKSGDDAAAQAVKVAYSNMPNLFFTKWATDYLILYRLQEMANPGYLSRMESRIKKDNQGQEFIVPPSSVIGYGG